MSARLIHHGRYLLVAIMLLANALAFAGGVGFAHPVPPPSHHHAVGDATPPCADPERIAVPGCTPVCCQAAVVLPAGGPAVALPIEPLIYAMAAFGACRAAPSNPDPPPPRPVALV